MEFTLRGENGDYLKVSIKEVFGFPDRTSPFGGYDTESSVEIKAGSYKVNGKLWITTGNIHDFFNALQNCQMTVKGTATLQSYENNLIVTLSYDQFGHAVASGTYIEVHYKRNSLSFEIESDQSFMTETLSQLERIYNAYGDNFGKKGRAETSHKQS